MTNRMTKKKEIYNVKINLQKSTVRLRVVGKGFFSKESLILRIVKVVKGSFKLDTKRKFHKNRIGQYVSISCGFTP